MVLLHRRRWARSRTSNSCQSTVLGGRPLPTPSGTRPPKPVAWSAWDCIPLRGRPGQGLDLPGVSAGLNLSTRADPDPLGSVHGAYASPLHNCGPGSPVGDLASEGHAKNVLPARLALEPLGLLRRLRGCHFAPC